MRTFDEALRLYRTRHQTRGCIVTHLFGIPMLILTPLLYLAGRKGESKCFLIGGLILQWLGHAVFEKNTPTIIETKDPMIIPAALAFIGEKWTDIATGKPLVENSDTELKAITEDSL